MEILQDFSEAGSASMNRYKKMKDPVQLGPSHQATKKVLSSLYYSANTDMWEKRCKWELSTTDI
jgi:hypothetical protein